MATGARIEGNLVLNCGNGIRMNTYTYGAVVANNTSVKNNVGFSTGGNAGNIIGSFVNNVAVGNTTNWQTQATGATAATKNAGVSGDTPWITSGGSSITMATTDFADYTNNDFRPASASSPQVEAGTYYYLMLTTDLAGRFRPDYMNGGAAAIDVGASEFDHGYGAWPATHALTLSNVVVGSRVHIESQDGATQHYDQTAAASSVVIPVTVYGDSRDDWRIRIRKGSASPYYRPWDTLMSATAGSSSIYVSQIPDE